MDAPKRILVTGGNSGIGYALCRQLVLDHGAFVYMGSRSRARGDAAKSALCVEAPQCQDRIDVVEIDVSSDASVAAAAARVKGELASATLYAIVNNAGTGLAQGGSSEQIVNTNLYGTKRVCEAFIPLLNTREGRVVNVGSGAGPSFVAGTDEETRMTLTSKDATWEQLEALCAKPIGSGFGGAYGLSKAGVSAYTMILARGHPNLLVSSLSPGFIDTKIVAFPGMFCLKFCGCVRMKPPEEGTVSIRHCLFGDLAGSGFYFGSDALRSPLDHMRNPGDPAFTGP